MNTSGDAAEQVVRLSLEGTEVALKLSGSAAKNIAAAIYAVMKNQDHSKLAGKQRLTAMLKSGKELKVFTVSEEHMKQFAAEAKRYGVAYCALKGKDKSADGLVDVMVRAEDAAKINRIVERFKLTTVDRATVESAEPEQAAPERASDNELVEIILGTPAAKEEQPENPLSHGMGPSTPSATISGPLVKPDKGTLDKTGRRSVLAELRSIQKARHLADPTKTKGGRHLPQKGREMMKSMR